MSDPTTVTVMCEVARQDGTPVEGAKITAMLQATDSALPMVHAVSGDIVFATMQEVTTDAAGEASLSLVPNPSVSNSANYSFNVQTTNGSTKFNAVVPAENTTLAELISGQVI